MKDLLGALDNGETVIVCHRGNEKATLRPISPPPGSTKRGVKTKDQPLFGLWLDRVDVADPDSYLRKLRQGRPFSIGSTTQKRSGRKRRK
jgi:hypothetical protein